MTCSGTSIMSSGHRQTQLQPGLVRLEGLITVAAMESQMLSCLVSGNWLIAAYAENYYLWAWLFVVNLTKNSFIVDG